MPPKGHDDDDSSSEAPDFLATDHEGERQEEDSDISLDDYALPPASGAGISNARLQDGDLQKVS